MCKGRWQLFWSGGTQTAKSGSERSLSKNTLSSLMSSTGSSNLRSNSPGNQRSLQCSHPLWYQTKVFSFLSEAQTTTLFSCHVWGLLLSQWGWAQSWHTLSRFAEERSRATKISRPARKLAALLTGGRSPSLPPACVGMETFTLAERCCRHWTPSTTTRDVLGGPYADPLLPCTEQSWAHQSPTQQAARGGESGYIQLFILICLHYLCLALHFL